MIWGDARVAIAKELCASIRRVQSELQCLSVVSRGKDGVQEHADEAGRVGIPRVRPPTKVVHPSC